MKVLTDVGPYTRALQSFALRSARAARARALQCNVGQWKFQTCYRYHQLFGFALEIAIFWDLESLPSAKLYLVSNFQVSTMLRTEMGRTRRLPTSRPFARASARRANSALEIKRQKTLVCRPWAELGARKGATGRQYQAAHTRGKKRHLLLVLKPAWAAI